MGFRLLRALAGLIWALSGRAGAVPPAGTTVVEGAPSTWPADALAEQVRAGRRAAQPPCGSRFDDGLNENDGARTQGPAGTDRCGAVLALGIAASSSAIRLRARLLSITAKYRQALAAGSAYDTLVSLTATYDLVWSSLSNVASSCSESCFWKIEPMVLESVLTVRGFEAPRCCRLATMTASFSSGDFVFATFTKGISLTLRERAAKTFLVLRC